MLPDKEIAGRSDSWARRIFEATLLKKHFGYLAAAFCVPMLLYCFSLDTDIGFWDTGEMNTVPYILGLAHPTGYPSEILLGWLFSHAVPIHDVAFRLTLLNATEIALASLLVYVFARAEGVAASLSLLASFVFATTPLVWQHATHTDVMSLAVLLVAATFLLVRMWHRSANHRYLWWAALTAGLAVGTHGAATIYLICALAAVAFGRPRPRFAASLLAAAILVAVAGGVYAYMPLRANVVVQGRLDPTMDLGLEPGSPFWDWGDPRSLSSFAAVVTGAQVSAPSVAASSFRLSGVGHDVSFGLSALTKSTGLVPLVLALVLVAFAFVRDWRLSFLLLSPTLVITPIVANAAFESDPYRYYIFPIWSLWTAAAIGLSEIAHRNKARILVVYGMSIVVAAVSMFQVYSNRSMFVERRDELARTYVSAALAATSEDAIIVAPWTYATPLAYAAYVSNTMLHRTLIPGEASEMEARVPAWLQGRPVYAISEQRPVSRFFVADLVCEFDVNPDHAHDPKLFKLGRTTQRRANNALVTCGR
jgi:4-amino-4-deoxy-L-arabinose transferase-like glycosyltransferase